MSGAAKTVGIRIFDITSSFATLLYDVVKACPAGNVVDFNETPYFIDVETPSPNQENVGATPFISWSGTGEVFQIFIFGWRGNEYFQWMIETMDNEFRLPEMSYLDLASFEYFGIHVATRSYWNQDFVHEDPSDSRPSDFTATDTSIVVFPGGATSSSKPTRSSLQAETISGKTTDGIYRYQVAKKF